MADKRPKQPSNEALKAKALSRWEEEGGAPAEGRQRRRPRDLNQWAKRMVDIAKGVWPGRPPTLEEEAKN